MSPSTPLLLADLDAEKLGQIFGVVIALMIPLGLIALFTLSLVKSIKTKSAGWIFATVGSGVLGLLLIGGILIAGASGFTKGYEEAKKKAAARAAAAAAPGSTASPAAAPSSTTLSSKDKSVSLTFPSGWIEVESTRLNTQSILSAESPDDQQYVIVIPNSRKDFVGSLETCDQIACKATAGAIADSELGEPERLEVNGCPAIQRRIAGTVKGFRAVYINTTIQTDGFYYQVMGWTVRSREAEGVAGIKAVTASFVAQAPLASGSGKKAASAE